MCVMFSWIDGSFEYRRPSNRCLPNFGGYSRRNRASPRCLLRRRSLFGQPRSSSEVHFCVVGSWYTLALITAQRAKDTGRCAELHAGWLSRLAAKRHTHKNGFDRPSSKRRTVELDKSASIEHEAAMCGPACGRARILLLRVCRTQSKAPAVDPRGGIAPSTTAGIATPSEPATPAAKRQNKAPGQPSPGSAKHKRDVRRSCSFRGEKIANTHTAAR